MPYATQQDLYDRFGQAEIDALGFQDAIEQALADASHEMDGYFAAAGYEIPVTNAPGSTTRICANIARANLYTDVVPDRVQKLHDDSVAWLKSVARGEVALGVAADGSEPAAEDNRVQFEGGGSVFRRGEDGLGGF